MIKIFTDFDGTISQEDVGDNLFLTFADTNWDDVVQQWVDGKISSKEVFSIGCETSKISRQQLEKFSDEQSIDPFFVDFVDYCLQKRYPVTVLSDGLDFYIRRILDNFGFQKLEVLANKLIFLESNKIISEFPYYEKGCLSCGNCKGYQLREHRNDGDVLVYIGDGYSDRCAVNEADVLFAKGDLKTYCQQNKIYFYEFKNFKDILEKFKVIEKSLTAIGV